METVRYDIGLPVPGLSNARVCRPVAWNRDFAGALLVFDHPPLARNALRESATEPRYIETVPARGYRFIAPIQDTPLSSPPALAPVAPGTPTTAAVPELQRTGTKHRPFWISTGILLNS